MEDIYGGSQDLQMVHMGHRLPMVHTLRNCAVKIY